MVISLDTNVWIFGVLQGDSFCEKIMLSLDKFEVIVPNQVRNELHHNLSNKDLKYFYELVIKSDTQLDYAEVPDIYVTMFKSKGLKKGDAIIGGFAEWKKIDKIVSDNRDFLRGLSAGHYFEVLSPQEFCEEFGL
jgi:predicted nucleic acid-binding protein